MKALIAALALITLMSASSFAGPGNDAVYHNQSPASPAFGSNGY
jgi:hypothetical protein